MSSLQAIGLQSVKSVPRVSLYMGLVGVLFILGVLRVPAADGGVENGGEAAVEKANITNYGQISVVGGEQRTRGGIASLANELRVKLNKLCGEPDREMKLPLIIKLHGAEGDKELPRSIVSRITNLQGQYQLLLHIHLARGVDQEMLRYHLMELLLYERGLGEGQLVEDGDRLVVKPWLILGMLEAISIRDGDSNRQIYQADIDFLNILPLEMVFETSEHQWRSMMGREPIAFRAIAGAIVNSLLRQKGGEASMAAYLADFTTFKGEYENLLRKHFPGMNQSNNSLSKWVNLELLELAMARVTEVYSMLETESRLEGLLKLRYRDPDGSAAIVGIDHFDQVTQLDQAARLEAVAAALAELERLSYRCFPTYRPILNEYGTILGDIAKGEDEGMVNRLAQLKDIRDKMNAAAIRARDYLDWYYITQSSEVSGNFDNYRALIEALENTDNESSGKDSVSDYLDEIQRIYGGNRQ